VLSAGPVHSLVELNLETGRKHQIRVQLAGAGCPVSGDEKYGSRTDPLGRLCLHASLIEISAGPGKAPLRFGSPVPPGFARAVTALASDTGETSTSGYSARAKAGRNQDSKQGSRQGSESGSDPRRDSGHEPRHAVRQSHTARPASRTGSGRGRKRGELPDARPGGRASNSYRGDQAGEPGFRRTSQRDTPSPAKPGTGHRKPAK
ncbi:MAG: hypothetical protein ABIJ86_15840, partial [Spirochaetota bacterium]